MKPILTRRTALKGMLGGTAITVGLPLLDCFLNGNGTALAQGAPLPVRFGTWFWGCGMNPDRWVPATEGDDFELPPELMALADVRDHVSILSGFNTILDGRANLPHWTGVMANLTGAVNIPATGGWQTWATVTATATLPAGQQTLTLAQDTGGWNLNYLQFTAGGSTGPVNLSAGRPTSESSHTDVYPSSNAVDGNQGTYWESANNAFPQWAQVDLGSTRSASRVVLQLPAGWGARDETLSLTASSDGRCEASSAGGIGSRSSPSATGPAARRGSFETRPTTRRPSQRTIPSTGPPAGPAPARSPGGPASASSRMRFNPLAAAPAVARRCQRT